MKVYDAEVKTKYYVRQAEVNKITEEDYEYDSVFGNYAESVSGKNIYYQYRLFHDNMCFACGTKFNLIQAINECNDFIEVGIKELGREHEH